MATREVLVEIKLIQEGTTADLGRLKAEIAANTAERNKLLAAVRKGIVLNAEETKRIGDLTAKIKGQASVVRELENRLSGTTAAGLRFRDKMAEASRAGLAEFGLQAVSIAAVGTAVAGLTKELFVLAGQIEKVDARNRAIAQESLPAFTRAAELSANALGLTQREYVSLAADQALRLKQLGIEGDLLTELSIQTVEYADKLGDFSGGQLSTEQAAKLLNDALTGQTKGLKELGVNVKASKEEIAANAQELMRSKGLTEEQATAVATLQLAFRDTGDTMKVFGDQLLGLDAAQDAATARFNEAKEALATSLIPAFTKGTEAVSFFTERWIELVGAFATIADSSASIKDRFLGILDAATRIIPPLAVLRNGFEAIFGDESVTAVNDLATATAAYNAALRIGNDDLIAKAKANMDAVRAQSGETLKAKAVQEEVTKATEEGTVKTEESTKAVEKKTKAVKELTQAQKDLAADMAASAAEPVTPLQPRMPSGAPLAQDDATLAAYGINPLVGELLQEQNDEALAIMLAHYDEMDALAAQRRDQQIADGEALLGSLQNLTQSFVAIEQARTANEVAEIDKRIQAQRLAGQSTVELEAEKEKALSEGAKRAFQVQRAFALAQLAIDTAKAISSLTAASAANPTNAVTFGAAGAAQFAAGIIQIVANIAQAAQLLSSGAPAGYEEGGFTAKRSKNTEPVGVVHANEWVAPAWQTQHPDYAPTIKWLEQARKRRGLRSNIDGFYGGGTVRGIAMVNTPRGPQTGAGTIAQADLSRALLSMPPPVVSVTEIREVSNRVSVVERMSRA